MKVLGICGSPRSGATEYVLKEALGVLEAKGVETVFFSVKGKQLGFCQHCDYCLEHKECVVKDDLVELYGLLSEVNGVILASPVHAGAVSGQVKTLMDRTRAWIIKDKNIFSGIPGLGIAVGGDRYGGQDLVLQQIITFFILNGIIPVSGGSFGSNVGVGFCSDDSVDGVKLDLDGFDSLNSCLDVFFKSL